MQALPVGNCLETRMGRAMNRKPNYSFERQQRDRRKEAKKEEKRKEKEERRAGATAAVPGAAPAETGGEPSPPDPTKE